MQYEMNKLTNTARRENADERSTNADYFTPIVTTIFNCISDNAYFSVLFFPVYPIKELSRAENTQI